MLNDFIGFDLIDDTSKTAIVWKCYLKKEKVNVFCNSQ